MRYQTKDLNYRKDYYRYGAGFILALLITYAAYFSVTAGAFEQTTLAIILLALAAVQLVVQMVVFLHVGFKKGDRWTLASIAYMFIMILIIVVASLWIMQNMNYNMHMTPQQMTEFMLEQNKKGF